MQWCAGGARLIIITGASPASIGMMAVATRTGFAVLTLLLQLAVGEDLYWVPRSNWEDASNWRLGRAPCSGEDADFGKVYVTHGAR